MEVAFRKIDIDAFDDDQLREEELYDPDPRSPEQVFNDAQTKSKDARSFLSKGDNASALSTLLSSPPYGPSSNFIDGAKLSTLKAITDVLSSTRTSDASAIISNLNHEEQDWLMKFLYKGMSIPEESNSSVFLNWHEKLTEVAGVGTIVRVMTDRRRV